MSRLNVKVRTLEFVVSLRIINHEYATLSDAPESAEAVRLFDAALARASGAGNGRINPSQCPRDAEQSQCPRDAGATLEQGMRRKVQARLVDLVACSMVMLKEFRAMDARPQSRHAVRRIERELADEVGRLGVRGQGSGIRSQRSGQGAVGKLQSSQL